MLIIATFFLRDDNDDGRVVWQSDSFVENIKRKTIVSFKLLSLLQSRVI